VPFDSEPEEEQIMKMHLSTAVAFVFLLEAGAVAAAPLGTAFTYQGQLQQSGVAAGGACDFEFNLWDSAGTGSPPSGGTKIGADEFENSVSVADGLFTVQLNDSGQFGAAPFNGEERWLQIGVSCPASGSPTFTTLAPRQKLTAAPYASFALNIPDGSVTAAKVGSGAVGQNQLATDSVNSAKIADNSVNPNDVSFNYAGSNVKGGPAADVSFPYAASTSKGGPATDVACSGCVGATDLQVPVVLSDSGAGPILSAVTTSTATSAIGVQGQISATAPGGSSTGVRGVNNGTSSSGFGVFGSHDGGGTGVFGLSVSGEGISGSSTSGDGVLAFSNSGVALHVRGNTGNLIEAAKSGRPDNRRFYVDNSGNVFADGSYNCGKALSCFNTGTGADVAERIDAPEPLQPGDLVEIDPDHSDRFRLARSAYSNLVAGVVSTNPGVTMNNNDLEENDRGERTDQRPLLALVGKVPVRVTTENGALRPGDLLVASATPGHAMKAGPNAPTGTVIGKALEPLESGTGIVKMLVMLR
jgi:hypothetical protein